MVHVAKLFALIIIKKELFLRLQRVGTPHSPEGEKTALRGNKSQESLTENTLSKP